MSEKKAEKKEEAAEGGEKKKGGIAALLTKLPVLLGGVMMIEAVVLFAGFKMLAGGPKEANAEVNLAEGAGAEHGTDTAAGGHDGAAPEAAGGHDAAPAAGGHGDTPAAGGAKTETFDPKKKYEVLVVEFRAPNSRSGRMFLYDVSIYAIVKGNNKSKFDAAIKESGALIKDRIRTIIGESEPEKLGGGSEPGLETLRRQVKFRLDEIVGEGCVDEVLIARCIPFRTDF